MRRYRIPAEQVIEADVLYLVDAVAPRHQFIDTGHRTHVDGQAHQGIDNFLAALRRRGGNSQQHLGNVVLGHQLFQFLRPRHLQAVDN